MLKLAAMGVNNRPANGKSYSRSSGLCRKEWLENMVLVIAIYSRARVFNGNQHTGTLLNKF